MVNVTGIAKVLARLEAAAAAMAGAAKERTENALAESAAAKARDMAPVLSGTLRDSIQAEGNRVVADAPYAAAVELGTTDTAPQPYMRPAIHQTESEVRPTARAIYRAAVPHLR